MNDLVDTTEMYLRTIYDLEPGRGKSRLARIAERLEQSRPRREPDGVRMERDGLLRVAGDRHLGTHREGRRPRGVGDAQTPPRRTSSGRCDRSAMGRRSTPRHAGGSTSASGTWRRLVQVLDNPTVSPFGNPIPGLAQLGLDDPGSEPDRAELVRLTELPVGDSVAVVVRQPTEHACRAMSRSSGASGGRRRAQRPGTGSDRPGRRRDDHGRRPRER